jgi:hypothetical protein
MDIQPVYKDAKIDGSYARPRRNPHATAVLNQLRPIVTKVFLLSLVVPAALLISFRGSNARFELSDLDGFAHFCTAACTHISILRK